jgi:hypothetical protein
MSVKKYTLRVPNLSGTTGTTLSIPIDMTMQLVDQDDIVQTKFVDVEVGKSINTILDYEKVRCSPIINASEAIAVSYKVHFLNDDKNDYTRVNYTDIGFNDGDIKFKKNSLIKSFLRLNFYDTDITSTQRLMSFVTLFPRLKVRFQQNSPITIPIPIQFNLADATKNQASNGEGFFIYHFKDEIPLELYMRAEFNNAKDGITTNLMSTNDTQITVDSLMRSTADTNGVIKNNIHTKYILTRGNSGYYYKLDTNYSNNVVIGNANTTYLINLYEISAI